MNSDTVSEAGNEGGNKNAASLFAELFNKAVVKSQVKTEIAKAIPEIDAEMEKRGQQRVQLEQDVAMRAYSKEFTTLSPDEMEVVTIIANDIEASGDDEKKLYKEYLANSKVTKKTIDSLVTGVQRL